MQNLKAHLFACRAVIPDMRVMKGGSIINFTSISYMMGNPGCPVYVVANSGINGVTRALARESGPPHPRQRACAGWLMTDKQKQEWVTLRHSQRILTGNA